MRGISESEGGRKGLFSNYECPNSLTLTPAFVFGLRLSWACISTIAACGCLPSFLDLVRGAIRRGKKKPSRKRSWKRTKYTCPGCNYISSLKKKKKPIPFAYPWQVLKPIKTGLILWTSQQTLRKPKYRSQWLLQGHSLSKVTERSIAVSVNGPCFNSLHNNTHDYSSVFWEHTQAFYKGTCP